MVMEVNNQLIDYLSFSSNGLDSSSISACETYPGTVNLVAGRRRRSKTMSWKIQPFLLFPVRWGLMDVYVVDNEGRTDRTQVRIINIIVETA